MWIESRTSNGAITELLGVSFGIALAGAQTGRDTSATTAPALRRRIARPGEHNPIS
jgi:hypothetical protein